jgi:hypothetical protein
MLLRLAGPASLLPRNQVGVRYPAVPVSVGGFKWMSSSPIPTPNRLGRVVSLSIPAIRSNQIRCLLVVFLALVPSLSAAQSKQTPAVMRLRIEATEMDKKLLLEKINEHASDHMRFELAADENYS